MCAIAQLSGKVCNATLESLNITDPEMYSKSSLNYGLYGMHYYDDYNVVRIVVNLSI